ncbi:MAG: PilZ domain-containing protein [Spirochaetales bacterium]|nr:PilZ domain-containing protein [Spirochaetales bacterium]
MTFLVVTDDADARELLCWMLLSLGVKGVPVEKPAGAKEKLEGGGEIGEEIAGAIIDVDDEVKGGKELAAALASDRGNRRMIVIAYSRLAEEETLAAAGVAGFLRKPAGRPDTYSSLETIITRAAGPAADKRRHIRIAPPPEEMLRLSFRVSGVPGLLSGKIIDLSMGGLGVELVSPGAADALKPETFIERMRFALRGRELSLSGVVVAVKGKLAGVRFTSLSTDDSKALAGYLFDKISL